MIRLKKQVAVLLVLLYANVSVAQSPVQEQLSKLSFENRETHWNDTVKIKNIFSFFSSHDLGFSQQDSLLFKAIGICRESGLLACEVRILNFWSQLKVSQSDIAFAHRLIQRACYLAEQREGFTHTVDYRDALLQQSLTLFYINQFDSTLIVSKKGIEISAAAHDDFNESLFNVERAISLSVNKADTALIGPLFRRASLLSQGTPSLHDDVMALHNFAFYQKAFPVNDIRGSLETLLKLQGISRDDELQNNHTIPYRRVPFFFRGTHLLLLKELAAGYFYLGDFEQATDYMHQCVEKQRADGRFRYLPVMMIEQAYFETYYRSAGRVKQLYDSAVQLSENYNKSPVIPVSYFYYVNGWLKEAAKDWPAAIGAYKKAVELGDIGITENHIALFRAYIENKDRLHADSLYAYVIQKLDSNLIPYHRIYFYKELPGYFTLRKETTKALEAGISYYKLKDSLGGITQYLITGSLEKQFKTKEKDRLLSIAETEKQLNQKQISFQKKQALFMVGGLIILLLAIGLLVRNYRIKNKYAAALEQKNTRIETLIRELHHRVKNNLQIVSGLLSLQANRLDDDAARQAMDDGRTRVDAMAMIHQKLYMDSDLAAVNIKDYLESLTLSLARSFGYSNENLHITVDLLSPSMDIDTAIPIGLIVNELVTNAFKHAFEHTPHPLISIALEAKAPGGLRLRLADNGKGKPVNAEASGFGMKLVHTLTRQLNGVISATGDAGTGYMIEFRA